MRFNRSLSHGGVAVAALLVGGLCGYGFAFGRRNIAEIAPTVSVALAEVQTNHVPTPVAIISARPIAVPRPIQASRSKTSPMNAGRAVASQETFRLHVPHGWPVVLVRAVGDGTNWVAQDSCEPDEGSLYVCHADFGNPVSEDFDQQFELAVVVARTADEARQFPAGTELRELPTELTVKRVIKVAHR